MCSAALSSMKTIINKEYPRIEPMFVSKWEHVRKAEVDLGSCKFFPVSD